MVFSVSFLASEGYLQYMIATHTKTLLMYADTTLKWAAQLAYVPTVIKLMGSGYC